MTISDDRALLESLFHAAVKAADPKSAMARVLPEKPKGRTVVIGAGKGAAQMGAAFEELWGELVEGVIVTRYGYAAPCKHLRVMEAAHPVPDEAGLEATAALFDAVANLGPDDLVVALICGGGSALLPCPPDGMTLMDEAALNSALLASGAPIGAMNAIRKQLSGIKGGRLAAAAHPAKVVSLIVSDVPGDNPAEVASGPTVPDTRDRAFAKRMIETYRIDLPEVIRRHLDNAPEDAPLPNDPAFANNEVHIIASAGLSLEAAATAAKEAGIPAVILSDAIEGEASDTGRVLAAITREVAIKDRPFQKPVILISGGETTVTLSGEGRRGGRNTEFLLAFALALEGITNVTTIAADTDGIDGSEDNAGAFSDSGTLRRIRAAGSDPANLLSRHDAWGAFELAGDLFVPGPTGTNVNDFRAILIR